MAKQHLMMDYSNTALKTETGDALLKNPQPEADQKIV